MTAIVGTLYGSEAAVAQFRIAAGEVTPAVRRAVARLATMLAAHIKVAKLSGQVLNVRSGRLRRSIHWDIENRGTAVYGLVGTDVEYGRAHELGFKGMVNVAGHLRKMRNGGKPVRVRPHARQMNLPARSFLRSALEDKADELAAGMRHALGEIIEKAGA